jgi:type IV secretory pathway TrbL component
MNEMTLSSQRASPAWRGASTIAHTLKLMVFVIMVLIFFPLMGFWIVALAGATLFLLPVGVMISALFPKAIRKTNDN